MQIMRSHSQIIKDAGGPANLIATLNLTSTPIHTVRSWSARNSIPAPVWQSLADHGLATLEELAADAAMTAAKRAANTDTQAQEAAA